MRYTLKSTFSQKVHTLRVALANKIARSPYSRFYLLMECTVSYKTCLRHKTGALAFSKMSTGYLNNGEDYLFKLLDNRDEKCIEYVSTSRSAGLNLSL